jgi:hypothetical protein
MWCADNFEVGSDHRSSLYGSSSWPAMKIWTNSRWCGWTQFNSDTSAADNEKSVICKCNYSIIRLLLKVCKSGRRKICKPFSTVTAFKLYLLTLKFSRIRSGFVLFGTIAISRSRNQRSNICAGVLPYLSASRMTIGFLNGFGADGHSILLKDRKINRIQTFTYLEA